MGKLKFRALYSISLGQQLFWNWEEEKEGWGKQSDKQMRITKDTFFEFKIAPLAVWLPCWFSGRFFSQKRQRFQYCTCLRLESRGSALLEKCQNHWEYISKLHPENIRFSSSKPFLWNGCYLFICVSSTTVKYLKTLRWTSNGWLPTISSTLPDPSGFSRRCCCCCFLSCSRSSGSNQFNSFKSCLIIASLCSNSTAG